MEKEWMLWLLIAMNGALLMVCMYFFTRNRTDKPEIKQLTQMLAQLGFEHERSEARLREQMNSNRQEANAMQGQLRSELTQTMLSTLGEMGTQQKNQLDSFAKQLAELTLQNKNEAETLRQSVEQKLSNLQRDNHEQLDKMRATVDEKLQATLEKRLGESFQLVSTQLEQVHKGLGEMQQLANGVGDLKKVLSNVKTRGTLGEIQLASILEQVLTTDQYAAQVATNKSSERVDFAVKLPAKEEREGYIWLPIDAKFPSDDYQRLMDALENADLVAAQEAGKQLEQRIKSEAKSIRDKYIAPPKTTDFAILFLPIEGLYAEVLRRPGLFEWLQRECRIVVCGPTTLAAFLNSLQMGFRTLAIETRSSEVWQLLGTVKGEFGKFGDLLDKTKKKLLEATNSIDLAARKSRTISSKLKHVEALPGTATLLLEDEHETTVEAGILAVDMEE